MNVPGHDGYTFSMKRTQVSVFEQFNQVRLAGLLKSDDGSILESQIRFEVLGDLTDQTLEGQLPQEKLGRLLVLPDLT